jgi:WD40 repeat protein
VFNLIRNRWPHRTLIVAILIALGVGIYQFEQPAPMCEIRGAKLEPFCFLDEGRLLVTHAENPALAGTARGVALVAAPRGPLQVWDTRSGAELASHFAKDSCLVALVSSPDGLHLAAQVWDENAKGDNRLFLVNALAGKPRELLVGESVITDQLYFSLAGDVVAFWQQENGLRFWDAAGGKPISDCDSDGIVAVTKDVLLYRLPNGKSSDIAVWSVREHKVVATIKDAPQIGFNASCSRDGQVLIAERGASVAMGKHRWGVWRLPEGRLEAEFESDASSSERSPLISADSRWLAIALPLVGENRQWEIRDLPDGKLAGTVAVYECPVFPRPPWHLAVEFSPAGFLAVNEFELGFAMFELPSMKLLWRFHRQDHEPRFSYDGRSVYLNSHDPSEVQCRDSATGEIRRRFWLPGDLRFASLVPTSDGRFLLMSQHRNLVPPDPDGVWTRWFGWIPFVKGEGSHPGSVAVVDTRTNEERFRIDDWRLSGQRLCAMLSSDGRTLVTSHDDGANDRVLLIWDVNARKPLHWPIGVPASLAALGVLWIWWRGWRRV